MRAAPDAGNRRAIAYSVNYKDALTARGKAKIAMKFRSLRVSISPARSRIRRRVKIATKLPAQLRPRRPDGGYASSDAFPPTG
jgi:hypothetical protein